MILSPTSQIGQHHNIVNITVTVRDISKISSNWSPKSLNCHQFFVSYIRHQHGCHYRRHARMCKIHKLESILQNRCSVSEVGRNGEAPRLDNRQNIVLKLNSKKKENVGQLDNHLSFLLRYNNKTIIESFFQNPSHKLGPG